MLSAKKIDIILPIFNEEKILADNTKIVYSFCQKNLPDYDWQIILAINGSFDNSLVIAENLSKNFEKIKTINIEKNGKGRALKTALEKSEASVMVYMDIDLAVDLKDLPNLITKILLEKYNLAIGSRLLKNSQTNRSWPRELSSRFYNNLANLLMGCKISDWQCGFKALDQESVKILLPLIADELWFFDTELLAISQQKKLRLTQIPIDWSENRYAKRKSKIKIFHDSFIFLKNLLFLKKRLKKY